MLWPARQSVYLAVMFLGIPRIITALFLPQPELITQKILFDRQHTISA